MRRHAPSPLIASERSADRHRIRGRIGNAFGDPSRCRVERCIRTFAAWPSDGSRDRLSDIADEAWDAATTVAEAAWDAAAEVADTAVDAVGYAAAHTGDVIGTVGTVVDTATLGVASAVLDVVDNTVLDTVDELTGGTIDIDFDDGDLSASVGVDGVLHVGAAVGDDGIRQSSDVLDQSYDVSATKDGLDAKGQAGIDWGPLPYAEGDVTVEADGDIAAHGRVQGTLPTPIGVLSGEAEAEIMREGDMWGASLDADGKLYLPSGDVVGGGVDAAYVDTPDGSALSVDVEGSYTRPGVGTVGGSLGYDRIETSDGVDRALRGRRLRQRLRRAGRSRHRGHQRHDGRRHDDQRLGRQRRRVGRSHRVRKPRSPAQTTSRRASTTCSAIWAEPEREQHHHTTHEAGRVVQRRDPVGTAAAPAASPAANKKGNDHGLVRQAEGLGRGQAGRRRG